MARVANVGPVRLYGDQLALVTVTRTDLAPERLLRSLPGATRRPVHVVAVGTAPAPHVAGVTALRLGEDIGRAAAVNRAIAGLAAAVGWVAVADPHVEWAPGALDVLLEVAARHPRAAALGPRLRRASGAVAASAGPLPGPGEVRRGRVPATPDADGPVGWLAGSCLLVRRASWDSVDGYDPRYPGDGPAPDPADLDLGDRLGRAGWLLVHAPSAEVTVHGEGGQGILESRDRGLRRYADDRRRHRGRAS
jgi:N-acetylglucosaminyl-diphospho-decaprenol L-rhamnosyltransferase